MADEYSIATREMAKELLYELGIAECLKDKFNNQPAQSEALLKEYRLYYKQAYEMFCDPSK